MVHSFQSSSLQSLFLSPFPHQWKRPKPCRKIRTPKFCGAAVSFLPILLPLLHPSNKRKHPPWNVQFHYADVRTVAVMIQFTVHQCKQTSICNSILILTWSVPIRSIGYCAASSRQCPIVRNPFECDANSFDTLNVGKSARSSSMTDKGMRYLE